MVEKDSEMAVSKQCELLGVPRSRFYYEPKKLGSSETEHLEKLRRRIDYWHTKHCYMGHRKIAKKLKVEDGFDVGKKLVRRLMKEMGLYAVYPKPNLSKPGKGHRVFPYLLKNMSIFLPNQVWAVDITYIPMKRGHMYLSAIIDWYSRCVVGWALSDTLETAPILAAVKEAIAKHGTPAIINSDQGSQFTSEEYIEYGYLLH